MKKGIVGGQGKKNSGGPTEVGKRFVGTGRCNVTQKSQWEGEIGADSAIEKSPRGIRHGPSIRFHATWPRMGRDFLGSWQNVGKNRAMGGTIETKPPIGMWFFSAKSMVTKEKAD